MTSKRSRRSKRPGMKAKSTPAPELSDEAKMSLIPTAIAQAAEAVVDRAEKAVEEFIGAADKSATTELSKKALLFTEQNVKAAFDHSKQLFHANNFMEIFELQTNFLKDQLDHATEQLKEIAASSVDGTKVRREC